MLVQSAVAVAAICLLAGCESTGLSPRETSMVSYPNYILSLESNPATNSAAATPQKIVTPIRLAVAQIGEDAPPVALLDKLAAQKTLVASVGGLPLSDGGSPYYVRPGRQGPDYASQVKAICGLAQAAGADYVLVIGGNLDSWEQHNSLSVLDITVVGGFIVPGGKIHVEGRGAGTLISTSTCKPVLFVSADAHTSALSPDFLVDGKTTAMDARTRDELAAKLGERFLNQLIAISGH